MKDATGRELRPGDLVICRVAPDACFHACVAGPGRHADEVQVVPGADYLEWVRQYPDYFFLTDPSPSVRNDCLRFCRNALPQEADQARALRAAFVEGASFSDWDAGEKKRSVAAEAMRRYPGPE